MKKDKSYPVNLLPKSVKKFFLDSIDKRAHLLAKQYIHNMEQISEQLLKHHLDFEMERLEIQQSAQSMESCGKEEYRLTIVSANSSSFGRLKEEFQKAEKDLKSMNPVTAPQIMLHIEDNTDLILSEMLLKKQLEISAKHPFRPSIGNTKHIH